MRHEPDDVAASVGDAGDVVDRAVRVHVDVTEHHSPLALKTIDGLGGGNESALTVLQGDGDLLVLLEPVGPRGRRVLHGQFLITADEVAVVVAHQAALEKVRLGEHLEAVADSENGHALAGSFDHLGHDRREAGDGAGPQVVAVAETTGKHERVNAFETVRAVPQGHRFCAGQADGALGVAIVERAREGDDADAVRHQWVSPAATSSGTMMLTTSSITELESIVSASSLTSASTSSVTWSTMISKRLPMRTPVKWVLPRRASAPATALPWGSSSSAFGMTSTTIVGTSDSRSFRADDWLQSTRRKLEVVLNCSKQLVEWMHEHPGRRRAHREHPWRRIE